MKGMALKKGKLSPALRSRLSGYYAGVAGAGPSYLDAKWRQWTETPGIVAFQAKSGNEIAGWIVYNPATSTVLDIITNEKEQRPEALERMIDALVREETLVSAEVLILA